MPTSRHLHAGLSITLALVSLTVGFGAVDLVSPWVLHEGTQVTDVGYGTLTGLVIPIALLAQTRHPASQVTGAWQLGVAALAFLVAGLLSGERGLLVAAATVAAAAAAVVALRSDRSHLLRGLGRPRLPMLVLALAACAPGSQYALHMAFNQRNGVLPADAHLGLQHWAALSAASLAALLTAMIASLRREAFTIPGLTAAAAVLAWGATCLAYPDAAGSLSSAWAWPAVVWSALFALVTVRERRESRAQGSWERSPNPDADSSTLRLPLVYQEQPDTAVHDVTSQHSKPLTTPNSGTGRTQAYSASQVRPTS